MSTSPATPPKRRFIPGGDTLVLCGLLLLFAALSFGIASQNETAPNPFGTAHRSSFSADAGGWMAFYRLLEKRGDRVRQVRRRPKEWSKKAGVVITGPYALGGSTGEWSEAEAQDALAWVSKGGVLIAYTDATDELTDALGLRTTEKAPLNLFGLDDADKKKKAKETKEAHEAETLRPTPLTVGAKGAPLTVRQPALFLAGVSQLKPAGDKRYTAAPAKSVALVADRLPLALAISYGKGIIFAISDAGIPDNTHLTNADNARFAVQMAEAYTTKEHPEILFDEYHQGYQDDDTFWSAIGRPGQLAFWQLTGLFLLMAYSASRRFGLPRPLQAPPRVSSEYVRSLADLYRRARASDAALESVTRIFWRDLCRAAGMPADAPIRDVAVRVVAAGDSHTEAERAVLVERITATVAECRAKIEAAEIPVPQPKAPAVKGEKRKRKPKMKPKLVIGEAELLRLVMAIETLRKELELGGRNPV